MDELKQF